jgi:hypothetical protein
MRWFRGIHEAAGGFLLCNYERSLLQAAFLLAGVTWRSKPERLSALQSRIFKFRHDPCPTS